MAGKKINSAFMSLTGDHVRGINTQGAVALNRNNTNGTIDNNSITVRGNKEISAHDVDIPNDISSASFFIVAALIKKDSRIYKTILPIGDGITICKKL